jgi:hypothetical protein
MLELNPATRQDDSQPDTVTFALDGYTPVQPAYVVFTRRRPKPRKVSGVFDAGVGGWKASVYLSDVDAAGEPRERKNISTLEFSDPVVNDAANRARGRAILSAILADQALMDKLDNLLLPNDSTI